MSNAIKDVIGYMVNGKFVQTLPNFPVVHKFQVGDTLYDSYEQAELARNNLKVTKRISTALANSCPRWPNDTKLFTTWASCIMNEPAGEELYKALKDYFEPVKEEYSSCDDGFGTDVG